MKQLSPVMFEDFLKPFQVDFEVVLSPLLHNSFVTLFIFFLKTLWYLRFHQCRTDHCRITIIYTIAHLTYTRLLSIDVNTFRSLYYCHTFDVTFFIRKVNTHHTFMGQLGKTKWMELLFNKLIPSSMATDISPLLISLGDLSQIIINFLACLVLYVTMLL